MSLNSELTPSDAVNRALNRHVILHKAQNPGFGAAQILALLSLCSNYPTIFGSADANARRLVGCWLLDAPRMLGCRRRLLQQPWLCGA